MNLLKPKKLRIRLKAYEPNLLDESCTKIVDVITGSGNKVVGPVPLPTRRRRYCVLRSPHVNKDSREHFEIRTHKRIIDVYLPSETTITNLRNLNLSAGLDIEIKNF
jgi:small subunit ribosomal protein S10